MKTPKEMDVLRKIEMFSDTPEVAESLEKIGLMSQAKHLRKMFTYHKALIAEIRKLRKLKNEI